MRSVAVLGDLSSLAWGRLLRNLWPTSDDTHSTLIVDLGVRGECQSQSKASFYICVISCL